MKATLVGLPTWDHALYDAVCCVGFPALVYCAAQQVKLGKYNSHELSLFGFSNATTLALALSLGPLVVGATLLLVTLRPRALKAMLCSGSVGKTSAAISKRLLYPFHLDKVRSQIAQTKQQLRYTQVGPLTTQHVCPSFRSLLLTTYVHTAHWKIRLSLWGRSSPYRAACLPNRAHVPLPRRVVDVPHARGGLWIWCLEVAKMTLKKCNLLGARIAVTSTYYYTV